MPLVLRLGEISEELSGEVGLYPYLHLASGSLVAGGTGLYLRVVAGQIAQFPAGDWDDGASSWDDGASVWDVAGDWDSGASSWDGGTSIWDAVAVTWDSGTSTWDGGSTTWSE